jgi:DNA-binding transcriptional MerR regulator
MGQQEPIRRGPGPSQEIPDKLYFRIGEVAKLCAIPAYVLRFWEGEFPQLKPNKGGTGQRLYRRRDVETALRVKSLLYDEGYTIPGARTALKAEMRGQRTQLGLGAGDEAKPPTVGVHQLRKLQKDLLDLAAMLSRPPGRADVHPIRGRRAEPQDPIPTAAVRAFPNPRLFDPLSENETVKP